VIADLSLGARVVPGGVRFRVWAPRARELAVAIRGERFPLARGDGDVFEGVVPGAGAGLDYTYVIDGALERPDPASRWQPHGVHGASRVVDPEAYAWRDAAWRGRPLAELVLYELHVGTFTPEGTFAAAIGKLDHLVALGVTAVELMPVAEFPGARNWGYDGVHLFAPASAYGGPDGLRALVDACHAAGLAVVLDVVYNHVGPEGNYLGDYAPYFTDRYRTPWGQAINYDDADSDGVRRHVIANAVAWFVEYHVDGLRLDAIHGIFDGSARHVLEELGAAVREATPGRHAHVIAESDLNDPRVIRPAAAGGHGLDAQWSDDFHHALRTALTGDRRGYYADFGSIGQLERAIARSFVYDGAYSRHRRRRHGSPAADLPGERFVAFIQNHDQIANGSQGRRITDVLGPRGHALAAALLLTSPALPLLFMGEELAAATPFVYFVSHGDPALVDAVREGRRRELADLGDLAALGELADPQAEATFQACKLDWSALGAGAPVHAEMLALYRDLIALRRRLPCLANGRKDLTCTLADEAERWLVVERADPSGQVALIACNLRDAEGRVPCRGPAGRYRLALATDDPRYGGPAVPEAALELAPGGGPVTLVLPPYAARIYVTDFSAPGPEAR
jgi:maltooligosyltrehalose trehalohydrolase